MTDFYTIPGSDNTNTTPSPGGSTDTSGGSSSGSTSQTMQDQFPGTSSGGSSGGFNLSSILPPGLGGSGDSNMQYLIPGMATAYQQYKNADQYMQLAGKYADQMNPFGSQRAQYQQELSQAQADPAKYISSLPSYQAALQLGLGAVNRGAMSRSGTVSNADDIAYASQLASSTWQNEMNRLGGLAGAGIGPGAAAALIQTGIQGSINAKNQALGAMFAPFYGQSYGSGGGGGGPGQGPGGTYKPGGVSGPGSITFQPPAGATTWNWGGQTWVKGPSGDWQPAGAAPINTPGGSPGNDTGTSDAGGSLFPPGSGGDMGPPAPDIYYDPSTYGTWQP